MNLLAIDTSTNVACIALSCKDNIFQHKETTIQNHATLILPIIDNLLKKANLEIKDLDGIVFGKGPGSFTGLRISCSVAQGIAYGYDLPVYPVSTLSAIAYKARQIINNPCNILTTLDARMHQLYWGFLPQDSQNYNFDEFVTNPGDIIIDANEIILAGVGWEQYITEFNAAVKEKIIQTLEIYPEAEIMLGMVKDGLVNPITAEEALPSYIRDKVTK